MGIGWYGKRGSAETKSMKTIGVSPRRKACDDKDQRTRTCTPKWGEKRGRYAD